MEPELERVSVREDDTSIYYTFCKGKVGVSFTVIKVGEEHVGCDLTTHVPDPYRGDPCSVWNGLPASCVGYSGGFARGFYRNLQNDTSERVDDARLFSALANFLANQQEDET